MWIVMYCTGLYGRALYCIGPPPAPCALQGRRQASWPLSQHLHASHQMSLLSGAEMQCLAFCIPPLPHSLSVHRHGDVHGRVLAASPVRHQYISWAAVCAWQKKSPLSDRTQACCHCGLINCIPQAVVAADPLSICPTAHGMVTIFLSSSSPTIAFMCCCCWRSTLTLSCSGPSSSSTRSFSSICSTSGPGFGVGQTVSWRGWRGGSP